MPSTVALVMVEKAQITQTRTQEVLEAEATTVEAEQYGTQEEEEVHPSYQAMRVVLR